MPLFLILLSLSVLLQSPQGITDSKCDVILYTSEPPTPKVEAVFPVKHEDATQPINRQENPDPGQELFEQYTAARPKSVLELQPFRKTYAMGIQSAQGVKGTVMLINLNPAVNSWYLLEFTWGNEEFSKPYHLENRNPKTQQLVLDFADPPGLKIISGKETSTCFLWEQATDVLNRAAQSGNPYEPLCDGRIFLRNKTIGRMTSIEKVTDVLRQYVWGGEKIIDFVKNEFFQDAFLNTSELVIPDSVLETESQSDESPLEPLVLATCQGQCVIPTQLGIQVQSENSNKYTVGKWYAVKEHPGVFLSSIQPKLVAQEVVLSQKRFVNALDSVESSALSYLIAFDLSQHDLGYELGTVHPQVKWSNRIPGRVRNNSLPGPDGIGNTRPLRRTGMVNPAMVPHLVATFTGGFKRYHGAFRSSTFATTNSGTHYGFIQNGVILSKLQPGLSTIVIFNDGRIDMKTWQEKDDQDLHNIRHARQNGLPLIDFNPETKTSMVGDRVRQWGNGNWSGSFDKKLRTVRSGIAIQETDGRRYLIYGYFSSATPSALARVFQAYRVQYAMQMDINALEHTYLALYNDSESHFLVQQLVKGMDVLDKNKLGQVVPRFVGYADNRDFFYVLRKGEK